VGAVQSEPDFYGEPEPDWILELRWKDRTERFAVEYKAPATPKRLRDAVARSRSYSTPELRPMVMAPYLDEEALDWLMEQEVSGVDFSGNGVVVVPGSWFVFRTGMPNAYPSSQYIKSIYTGRSSLVCRILLLCREFGTVTAVRDEIRNRGGEISLSTVSKVLKSLENELVVGRERGVRLLQPDRLLDRLVRNFQEPEVGRRRLFRAKSLDAVLEEIMEQGRSADVNVAGRGERVYTSFPGAERMLELYVSDIDALDVPLEPAEGRGFADLRLLETTNELVFFDRRLRDGFLWTSPLQTYFEHATGGKREREISQQMRDSILDGSYA
jgi:hypothetical protein